jgi:hypothetical protein
MIRGQNGLLPNRQIQQRNCSRAALKEKSTQSAAAINTISGAIPDLAARALLLSIKMVSVKVTDFTFERALVSLLTWIESIGVADSAGENSPHDSSVTDFSQPLFWRGVRILRGIPVAQTL